MRISDWSSDVCSSDLASHTLQDVMQAPMPLLPGDLLFHNLAAALFNGPENVMAGGSSPALMLMVNSIIMSLAIAVGKIAISLLSAFAIVYFRFPLRMFFFWMIFITLKIGRASCRERVFQYV